MINLFDLNSEELILLSNLLALKISENYTYREIGLLSSFVNNLSAQLTLISIKGLYDDSLANNPDDSSNTAAPYNSSF